MLKYGDLTVAEQEMVNREVESNFNISAKNRIQYTTLLQAIHSNTKCCNCFRIPEKCCCDKIGECFDELDAIDEPD